ncbi:MAG: hypothetical protein Q9218_005751 [Villophora microphyllina]
MSSPQVKRKTDDCLTERSQKRPNVMGRPSVLSASQKRKLVRLYLYSNLDLDALCNLLGFRHTAPRKRAVQYTLRKLLGDDYQSLRPKTKAARRNRLNQVLYFESGGQHDSKGKRRSRSPTRTKDASRDTASTLIDHEEFQNHDSSHTAEDNSTVPCPHDDNGWMDLINWDGGDADQEDPAPERCTPQKSLSHPKSSTERSMKSALLKQVWASLEPLFYIWHDSKNVTKGSQDFEANEEHVEIPHLSLGPEGKRLVHLDDQSSMSGYTGLTAKIDELSKCSTTHKEDIRIAFRKEMNIDAMGQDQMDGLFTLDTAVPDMIYQHQPQDPARWFSSEHLTREAPWAQTIANEDFGQVVRDGGSSEGVEYLIKYGPDVEYWNSMSMTPLFWAVVHGNLTMTRSLVRQRANVHAQDGGGTGMIEAAFAARSRELNNIALYAKITACISLIIDAVAVRQPPLG